ncbi:hypothetical protein WR25_06512 [Diploscapter pachys]|uniref:Uncharacterized protein n=1 Tax=Diploscapter pachys TaxID=2018661 RepID=A0A2A2JXD8_9BILA|nr:hypothetical protein WR25_06512 [Diploscapter pachys]
MAVRRFAGISSPHTSQSVLPSPEGRRDRAAKTASMIVASIWSCTALSGAHPFAIATSSSILTLGLEQPAPHTIEHEVRDVRALCRRADIDPRRNGGDFILAAKACGEAAGKATYAMEQRAPILVREKRCLARERTGRDN